ncbi:hypothetical protein, partial [Pseudomonas aeruginosa]|uniref:hypothetical protein n=1 Tax=Pseudomonas aeruginosa TaxID=287 RepID=UPI0019692DD2
MSLSVIATPLIGIYLPTIIVHTALTGNTLPTIWIGTGKTCTKLLIRHFLARSHIQDVSVSHYWLGAETRRHPAVQY